MSMAERKIMTRAVKNPVKRKLTRAEKKEIAAVIQAAKGDGKPHTAQQTIPYLQMYPDGICRVTEKKYSKSLVFEDIIPGIQAGKNAGMEVCAVEDAYSIAVREEKAELADYYIEDFFDFF